MSVSIAKSGGPTYQPYQCSVCQSRFTRHENLKRHAALHSRSHKEASLSCDICDVTFSRSDLRHRHMKKKHPEQELRRATKRPRRHPSVSTSNDEGIDENAGDTASSASPPETQSIFPLQYLNEGCDIPLDDGAWEALMQNEQRQPSIDSQYRSAEGSSLATSVPKSSDGDYLSSIAGSFPRSSILSDLHGVEGNTHDATNLGHNLFLESSFLKPNLSFNPDTGVMDMSQPVLLDESLAGFDFQQAISHGALPDGSIQPTNDWYPSPAQIEQGCDLFFTHVSPFVPFLHCPTFLQLGTLAT